MAGDELAFALGERVSAEERLVDVRGRIGQRLCPIIRVDHSKLDR